MKRVLLIVILLVLFTSSCSVTKIIPSHIIYCSRIYYSKEYVPEAGYSFRYLILNNSDNTYSLTITSDWNGAPPPTTEFGYWAISSDSLFVDPMIELTRKNGEWDIVDCSRFENRNLYNVNKTFIITGPELIDITDYNRINSELFGLPPIGGGLDSFGSNYILLN